MTTKRCPISRLERPDLQKQERPPDEETAVQINMKD